jgi:carbon-monoxide dehydrogenase catalytic subunit
MVNNDQKEMSRVADAVSGAMLTVKKTLCNSKLNDITCSSCHLGPCKMTDATSGLCGADIDTVAARNLVREVVSGTAVYAERCRQLVYLLKNIALGKSGDFSIKNVAALNSAAKMFGIIVHERTTQEIAVDLAEILIKEFTEQDVSLKTLTFAPQKQQQIWKNLNIEPSGIDKTIIDSMHKTIVNDEFGSQQILMHGFSSGLASGWGASRCAVILSEILFGSPSPSRNEINLGILEEKKVNIILNHNDPVTCELLSLASQAEDIIEYAKKSGADGVMLSGIGCKSIANYLNSSIPIIGSNLDMEGAIKTGLVDAVIVSSEGNISANKQIVNSYHTKIFVPNDTMKILGCKNTGLNLSVAMASAKDLVCKAISNFKNRNIKKAAKEAEKNMFVGGFSASAIIYMLGGTYRGSLRPLTDAVIADRIHGIVSITGCISPDESEISLLVKELIKRNILVLTTGCTALAAAKEGLLTPEAAEFAGDGLKEICDTVGIPPVLHIGSCYDNARILEIVTAVASEIGLDDISVLPFVALVPSGINEKDTADSFSLVASGVDVILGDSKRYTTSEKVAQYLTNDIHGTFNASFHECRDTAEIVKKTVFLIDNAREKLGINKKTERKLYDMKDRRSLDV